MEAGKLVISEKPVTTSSSILEEMIAASERTGSVFTVHQNRRWDEDFRVAEKIAKSGDLGRVYLHPVPCPRFPWHPRRLAQHQGARRRHGAGLGRPSAGPDEHDDGQDAKTVYATLSNVTNEEVDDGFTAIFTFDDGLVFTVEVGTSNFINLPAGTSRASTAPPRLTIST